MKITITTLDLEISPRAKRTALGLGITALIAGFGAVAYGNVKHTFKAGDPLSAQAVNDDFAGLDARLTALEGSARAVGTVNGKAYSVGATVFVKETAAGGPNADGSYDGAQVGGYGGAKAICEAATGSASAHMCVGDELIRSAASGAAAPAKYGWYAGAYRSNDGTGTPIVDCNGYVSNISNNSGPVIGSAGWNPTSLPCNQPRPILCCD